MRISKKIRSKVLITWWMALLVIPISACLSGVSIAAEKRLDVVSGIARGMCLGVTGSMMKLAESNGLMGVPPNHSSAEKINAYIDNMARSMTSDFDVLNKLGASQQEKLKFAKLNSEILRRVIFGGERRASVAYDYCLDAYSNSTSMADFPVGVCGHYVMAMSLNHKAPANDSAKRQFIESNLKNLLPRTLAIPNLDSEIDLIAHAYMEAFKVATRVGKSGMELEYRACLRDLKS